MYMSEGKIIITAYEILFKTEREKNFPNFKT